MTSGMTQNPHISVCVPRGCPAESCIGQFGRAHARFLRRRIESVLCQTYQDFELILLDDCSSDESRSLLSEYAGDPRVRIKFNEVNSGSPFRQWNKGVGLARGEYVWIAESDDYADERMLERLLTVLEAEPEVVFAYCR